MHPVSFIIPCYNSESTIQATVDSLINGNILHGDEIVVCDDGSSDLTWNLLCSLSNKHEFIKVFRNSKNLGGAHNRNKCIENSSHDLIFCLDSDNYLYPGSVAYLRSLQAIHSANAVAFNRIDFCKTSTESISYFNQKRVESTITHTWQFMSGPQTLDDYLATGMVAGASGNYLFTKKSWVAVGGYPAYSHALDTWGFGLKQCLLDGLFLIADFGSYLHTYGHSSYWTRLGNERVDIMNRIITETAASSYVNPTNALKLINSPAQSILKSYNRDPAYLHYKKLRFPVSTVYSIRQFVRQKIIRAIKAL